jgi:hypothetical protein
MHDSDSLPSVDGSLRGPEGDPLPLSPLFLSVIDKDGGERECAAGAVVAAAFLPLLIGGPFLIGMAVGERINRLALAVHLEDESDALCSYFRVDDVYPNLFMDRLGPLLNSVQVPPGVAPESDRAM